MSTHKRLLFIEIIIKIIIIFIIIHFVNKRMEYYITDNYGLYWYYNFVIITNFIGFVIGQILIKVRINKEIKREIFTTYYNDCIRMYNICKTRIAKKNNVGSIEPHTLIHAIAIHEFIINEYGGKNEESIFFRHKDSTLTAMSFNRIELVLTGIDLLLASLNNTQFDIKPIK